MNFQPYPFEKLQKLISNITPQTDFRALLSIGEPQFPTPKEVVDTLKDNAYLLNKYPKSNGEEFLRQSLLSFIHNRYGLTLQESEIIHTLGTREVLFNFPQYFLFEKKSPTIAYPNPFYQIYEGAAIASRARVVYMNLAEQNGFKPTLSEADRKACDLVILNSPNNPTGVTLTLAEMKKWVEWALEYDFVILSDECYCDIYSHTPPSSILQACMECGNTTFKNILCINSISKRSCAPGLRSGFIAGDKRILEGYRTYRTYVGCALPLPLQHAAAKAWLDTKTPQITREKYAKNLQLARDILGVEVSRDSFYVWLYVGDDEDFIKTLWGKEGVLGLCGRYLGREGIGEGYVRLALVYEENIIKEALEKIAKYKSKYHNWER